MCYFLSNSPKAGDPLVPAGAESLIKVSDDVLSVLDADGKAHGTGSDAGLELLSGGHLGVRGRGRMDDKALGIGHVGEQGEKLQAVHKFHGCLSAALQVDEEDGSRALREIALIEGVVRGIRQRRMMDFLHERAGLQIIDDLQGVLHMPLHAQGQGLESLQDEETVEGREAGALIAQELGPDIGDERSLSRDTSVA